MFVNRTSHLTFYAQKKMSNPLSFKGLDIFLGFNASVKVNQTYSDVAHLPLTSSFYLNFIMTLYYDLEEYIKIKI